MKHLLSFLTFLTFAAVAAAQTTTNIAVRVTVETITGGVTNAANAIARYDYGSSTADTLTVDGLALSYADNVRVNGVNAPLFPAFIRQEIKDLFRSQYLKPAADAQKRATAVQNVPTIIANQWENLTVAQKSQLQAIAAAFPNP